MKLAALVVVLVVGRVLLDPASSRSPTQDPPYTQRRPVARYVDSWKTLKADSDVEEVVCNFFIRQPVLWLD
jgi:hypothetical protein